jgi:hypothetical protein
VNTGNEPLDSIKGEATEYLLCSQAGLCSVEFIIICLQISSTKFIGQFPNAKYN